MRAVLSHVVTGSPSSGSRDRSLIGGIVGRVAPVVMRQIDANDLVDAIDVNVIADDLDLDRLVARLDVNAIAGQLDLDMLVSRLDVDAIANQLDLDALVGRLDVNAIAERLDLDALVERMDINAIAAELDMAKITAGATQDVAASGLDLVRRQIMRADATVDGVVNRLLRRDPAELPTAPSKLADLDDVEIPETVLSPKELQRQDVSGHYSGPVTRGLAIVGDLAAVAGLQALIGWAAVVLFGLVFDVDASDGAGRWVGLALLGAVFIAWFWIPVALFGRTIAMAVLGIGVVRRDGGIADGRRSLVRALVFPISIVLPFCLIGLVVGKERRALHDVLAGTTVVYDWGARDAEQPVTIREQLSTRVRRRES